MYLFNVYTLMSLDSCKHPDTITRVKATDIQHLPEFPCVPLWSLLFLRGFWEESVFCTKNKKRDHPSQHILKCIKYLIDTYSHYVQQTSRTYSSSIAETL